MFESEELTEEGFEDKEEFYSFKSLINGMEEGLPEMKSKQKFLRHDRKINDHPGLKKKLTKSNLE